MKPYLLRGALAGVAGSIASVLTLLLLGESRIRSAIELEAAAAAPGETHEEMFSRSTQVLGGALGLILFGVFAGLVFGVVYAANRHRLGSGTDWQRARRLGAVAFVTVYLVPFLKYPANPPAVGDPETINQRTIAYLSMLVISVLAVVLAAALHDRLRRADLPEGGAQLIAVAAWLVIIGIAMAVLPANPDAITIPADLAWSFRLASAAGQAAFWAVTATVFGLLSSRAVARREAAAATSGGPASSSTSPVA